mgnify:CR=1 FL=1
MKNKLTIIRQAEKIKAILFCGIVAIIPVFNMGYKFGSIVGQFLFH